MSLRYFRLAGVFLFLAIVAKSFGGDVSLDLIAKLKPVPPCAALVAAARTNHIPMEQIDSPSDAKVMHVGDSVTALVTLFANDGTVRQWIVFLEAAEPNGKERAAKLPQPVTLYSSFGGKYEFLSTPKPVSLRTFGPFVDMSGKKKVPRIVEKSARFSVDESFLGLGLDQATAIISRLKSSHEKGNFFVASQPLDEKVLNNGRKLAAEVKLTKPEERALVASVPALVSYVGIVAQTEGLSDILSELVKLPSAWSMIRNGGVNPEISLGGDALGPADAAGWNLPPGIPLYYLPLSVSLNKEPALNLTLVVTRPNPPLLTCGGVIGLLAEKIGDKKTYMTLRIVSARSKG